MGIESLRHLARCYNTLWTKRTAAHARRILTNGRTREGGDFTLTPDGAREIIRTPDDLSLIMNTPTRETSREHVVNFFPEIRFIYSPLLFPWTGIHGHGGLTIRAWWKGLSKDPSRGARGSMGSGKQLERNCER